MVEDRIKRYSSIVKILLIIITSLVLFLWICNAMNSEKIKFYRTGKESAHPNLKATAEIVYSPILFGISGYKCFLLVEYSIDRNKSNYSATPKDKYFYFLRSVDMKSDVFFRYGRIDWISNNEIMLKGDPDSPYFKNAEMRVEVCIPEKNNFKKASDEIEP